LKIPITALLCLIYLPLTWPTLAVAEDLSYAKIKHLYQEGEFEKVRVELENYLEIVDEATQIEESAFAYKYLAVVYASKTDGMVQAETYFTNLLDLNPDAYLGDLFVSDRVNDLFNKTKSKHQGERKTKNAKPLFSSLLADSKPAWPWVLGVTVVAGAVGIYYWASSDSQAEHANMSIKSSSP
jgi:tetratricopeptide (TPR) repeat protein